MKKQFIFILAALLLSSCASSGSENDGSAEIPDTVSTAATVTTSETADIGSTVTTTVTEETSRETTTVTTTAVTENEPLSAKETVLAEYLTKSGVVIPLDLSGKDTCREGVCLETIDGVPYDDFPAKEDIPAAIETSFENFFKDTEVWYVDEREGGQCSIENLRLCSGIYLDFDGDGEKESLMVIENDSDYPFTGSSAVVFRDGENTTLLLTGEGSSIYIYALVYSDCVNLVVVYEYGASGQSFELYTYNGGFNKVWDQGKGDVCSDGNRVLCYSWYSYLGGDLPHYLFYNSEKKTYELVGMEELTREELTEKLPEMSLLCQGIEEMYGKEITKIETEGWINFYFHLGDEYVRAYILNGSLNLMTAFNDDWNWSLHDNGEKFGLDIAYGLFLPGEFDQSDYPVRQW